MSNTYRLILFSIQISQLVDDQSLMYSLYQSRTSKTFPIELSILTGWSQCPLPRNVLFPRGIDASFKEFSSMPWHWLQFWPMLGHSRAFRYFGFCLHPRKTVSRGKSVQALLAFVIVRIAVFLNCSLAKRDFPTAAVSRDLPQGTTKIEISNKMMDNCHDLVPQIRYWWCPSWKRNH